MGKTTYKFKWENWDRDDYCRDRKNAASALRRDAELLRVRADEIDSEVNKLEQSLLPVAAEDDGDGD